MNAAAALMAWFVLKPMRRAQMNESVVEAGHDLKAGAPVLTPVRVPA